MEYSNPSLAKKILLYLTDNPHTKEEIIKHFETYSVNDVLLILNQLSIDSLIKYEFNKRYYYKLN